MTPNIYLHPVFGKLLFAAGDVAIGALVFLLVPLFGADQAQQSAGRAKPRAAAAAAKGTSKRAEGAVSEAGREEAIVWACVWLFNPFSIVISTRGNAESLISLLVVGALYCLLTDRLVLGAVLYGLSVHFKIYPIIYALPLVLFVKHHRHDHRQQQQRRQREEQRSLLSVVVDLFRITREQAVFALVSGGTFVLLSLALYAVYAFPFLHHTYLYHITRTDHRHNFSPYFYHLYLLSSSSLDVSGRAVDGSLVSTLMATLLESPRTIGLLAFLPQVVLLVSFSFRYALSGVPRDLALCLFLQTFTFVSFLKVCTSQVRPRPPRRRTRTRTQDGSCTDLVSLGAVPMAVLYLVFLAAAAGAV
jgi:phosphatidylinositol glycan class M